MGDIELQAFSERLKELRHSLNMTQKDFADKIGVTAAALSAYENNIKNPSIAVAKRIADFFNVSIDWLCGLSDNKEINHKSIRTYADIINICETNANSRSAIENIVTEFRGTMYEFIKESNHMQTLKDDGMIDQELYDLWFEKTLKKYDIPITLEYDKPVHGTFGLHMKNLHGQEKKTNSDSTD